MLAYTTNNIIASIKNYLPDLTKGERACVFFISLFLARIFSSLLYSCKVCIYELQAALGFELWSMTEDILFDNLLITDDISVAEKLAEERFVMAITQTSVISFGRETS